MVVHIICLYQEMFVANSKLIHIKLIRRLKYWVIEQLHSENLIRKSYFIASIISGCHEVRKIGDIMGTNKN